MNAETTDNNTEQEPPIAVLLGLPFHDLTNDEALEECRRALKGEIPGYFVTANVDFAAQAYGDPNLRTILFYARRVFCDGMPLIWISKILGHPLRERVAGSDITPKLLEECAKLGKRVYLFGSDESTLERVVQVLGERMPKLEIAGYESPPMGQIQSWRNSDIVERVRNSRTDLLLVALGCPKQENWIYQYAHETGAQLSIGIGASLDFIAGKQTRAPAWMQKTGMEWFWRMATNPKRLFGRYARDFIFLALVTFKQRMTLRRRAVRPAEAASEQGLDEQAICKLSWSGSAERANIDTLAKPPDWSRPVLLDLSAVDFIDSGGMGALAGMARQARENEQVFALCAPSDIVRGALKAIRMDTLLVMLESEADFAALIAERQTVSQPNDDPSIVKIILSGYQDASNEDQLKALLAVTLAVHKDCRTLVIDCAEVTFMDSRAICALLSAARKLNERQGRVELQGMKPQVRELIRMLRLDTVLPDRKQKGEGH